MIKFKIITLYRQLKAITQSVTLFFRHFSVRKFVAPAHNLFYISPTEIQWLTNCENKLDEECRNRNFAMEKYRGTIIGGRWDKCEHRFEELAVFKAIKQRIMDNTCWTDTEFYSECMADIENGRVLWKCTNSEQLLKRFSFIDNIILDMKNNGYKAGFDSCLIGEDPSTLAKKRKYSDEITINIGREGDCFFQDGRHRLAIAKVLGVPKVPVKVLVRHTDWYQKLKLFKPQDISVVDTNHPDFVYLLELNKKL